MKILDEHLEDVLDLAHFVLGVEKSQLEYMTMPSLGIFFGDLIKNEPNIIEECVNFLSQSIRNSAKAVAEKHGGSISVSCHDGKVQFAVSIPIKKT